MKVREFVSSMFMLAVAIVFWIGADRISRSPLEGQISAAGFPKLLAVCLGALAVIRMVQLALTERRARDNAAPGAAAAGADSGDGDVASQNWRLHGRAAGLIALGIGYIAILPTLGYLLSIALLLAAVALYNGRRLSIGLGAVVILGAVLLYLMFVQLLGVPLPAGVWAGLFDGSR